MEYLDIVDDQGNPTGKIIERKIAHQKGVQHRTSHVWLLRKKDQLEILVQKRSDNKDSYPGCYDISSAGHIPAGVDYKASAVRELQEELGIYVNEDQLIEIGMIHTESKNIFHGSLFHNKQVSKVFLLWYDQDEFNYQKEELAGTKWMNFEECYAMVKNNSESNCIHIEELDFIVEYLKKPE